MEDHTNTVIRRTSPDILYGLQFTWFARAVKKHRPLRLQRIIESSGAAAGLLRKAQEKDRTTEHIRGLLPAELADHLSVALRDGERLMLLATSPAWASRIRFALPSLQPKLRGIRDIKVRAVPAYGTPNPPAVQQRRLKPLSAQASEQIETIAAGISDPVLKHALLRLASHRIDE